MPGTSSYELQRPTRQPALESDVWVPLAQGLITALLLGTSASILLWAGWGVALWPTFPVATSAAAMLTWLWRMGAVGETLWTIERTLGVDLDGDEVVGEPEAHIVTINGGPPPDPAARLRAEFVNFIKGCCAGDTSLRRWEAAGMSRERYQEFRDRLIKAGFAQWNSDDKRQGWKLTAPANHIIERIM